jgi:hypothetical protein
VVSAYGLGVLVADMFAGAQLTDLHALRRRGFVGGFGLGRLGLTSTRSPVVDAT